MRWDTTLRRCIALLHVQNGQVQCRVVLLLADWRQYADAAVPDLELRLTPFTVGVSELDAVQALSANLSHLIG